VRENHSKGEADMPMKKHKQDEAVWDAKWKFVINPRLGFGTFTAVR